MNKNNALRDALNAQDISAVHSYLYTMILSDPGFQSSRFDDALRIAIQQLPQVIEPHNGEELKPESEWAEEYYDLLTSKLIDNFSMERINQLKKVARVLYPTPAAKPVQKVSENHSPVAPTITVVSKSDSMPNRGIKKAEAKEDKTTYFVFLAGIVVLFGLLVSYLFRKD